MFRGTPMGAMLGSGIFKVLLGSGVFFWTFMESM